MKQTDRYMQSDAQDQQPPCTHVEQDQHADTSRLEVHPAQDVDKTGKKISVLVPLSSNKTFYTNLIPLKKIFGY